jgi:hypothetical protein
MPSLVGKVFRVKCINKGRSPNVKTTVACRSGRRRILSEVIDYVANMSEVLVVGLVLDGVNGTFKRTRRSEYFTDCGHE